MLMLYCPQGNIASNVASQDITSSLNFEILPDKCIKSSERNGTKKNMSTKRPKPKRAQKKKKKTTGTQRTVDGNGGRQRRRRANSSGGRPCGQLIQGGRP